ncbi:MAG TPA: hypothetical protein VKV32_04580 [Stellaceae bacterium]|nr:hypothetical protein [Stellaceae bacterium]
MKSKVMEGFGPPSLSLFVTRGLVLPEMKTLYTEQFDLETQNGGAR